MQMRGEQTISLTICRENFLSNVLSENKAAEVSIGCLILSIYFLWGKYVKA